jgi:hypothetical protein
LAQINKGEAAVADTAASANVDTTAVAQAAATDSASALTQLKGGQQADKTAAPAVNTENLKKEHPLLALLLQDAGFMSPTGCIVGIAKSSDTTFDKCTDLASAEAILNGFDDTVKIGVQMGTTGEFYVKGDESWGFAGLKTQCVSYKSGALAVQDLLNGKVDYVIIDVAPANCITEAINEMQ